MVQTGTSSNLGVDRSEAKSQLLLFGDLSLIQFEDSLRRLLHVKTNPLLTSFFQRSNYALRRRIESLPSRKQELFPHFVTFVDLLSRLGETEGTPVLAFFLLSVHQVAQAIKYFTELSQPFPPPLKTYVTGPCTGGFAATAVSCSQSLPDLVSNGVDAVMAAFGTAFRSYLVGESLSLRQTRSQDNNSWSAIISPLGDGKLASMVEEYKAKRQPFRDSTLWISAITPGKATTLSGTPNVLKDFVAVHSEQLRVRYLDVNSPYHTSLLFDEADVDEAVANCPSFSQDGEVLSANQIPLLPFLSTSTGEVIAATNFRGLLRSVVQAALKEPVRWDLMVASFHCLLQSQHSQCTIVPFSSNATSMVTTSLNKDSPDLQITVTDPSQPAANNEASSSQPTGRFSDSKIAIVGYSGRFPSAESNEAFWELLRAARDVHREIPADRFDWKSHYDPTGKTKNTSRVKYGCFIDEPGLFDTRFFNMSPREAENTDPAQRLAITTTYEAMEMAGMVRNRTPSTQQDRVGVFFGTTSDDWREVNSGQDVGTYFIPGGNRAFVPGRISYFFRFSGPSLSIDTACSSSFAAIQLACGYLWRGECDTAIAGGTNVLTNPDNFAGLDRGHFLSTTGNCNAFDDGASGYCRSDAVATVILKRLEDAEADNDPIFGVIVGTNTNHCGQTESITRPHEGDQASVFKHIIRNSNLDPLDVSYVEMHGTGTQAGDATEMNSVLSVFAPDYKRTKGGVPRPLFLGSAKANIGHAESASGVSSLIKILMMMKHSEIPRHCGIKTRINRHYPLDLDQRGVKIAMQTTPWRREDTVRGKRAVFLNNFSAAGGNTAVLLEDAPLRQPTEGEDPRSSHIVTVTAKTPQSLINNIDGLLSHLSKNQGSGAEVSLPALSYTTTARRMHHNYRVAISGSDTASIIASLTTRASEISSSLGDLKPIPTAAKKKSRVVFMFSGQGTLYAGLGRTLFESNAIFRRSITRLDRLAQKQSFPSFIGLIDGSVAAESLDSVNVVASQLVLTCVQIALYELWTTWGVVPTAVVGHSLGEYAALHAAGVISAADAVYLVGMRASLLETRCTAGTHSMLAVKGPLQSVDRILSSTPTCELACSNQPSGHVIAGPVGSIVEAAEAASKLGVETVRLEVPFAFHSAQVDPILIDFERSAAQAVTFHPPHIPVLSPLLGKVVPAGEVDTLDASYLMSACRGKVDFEGALAAAPPSLGLGADVSTIWLELGSHPVCCGMVKGTLGSQAKTLGSLRRNVDAYKTLTASLEILYLAGVEIEWNEYHRDFTAAHTVVELPSYAWDLKKYWIMYKNDFCLTKGDIEPQRLPAVEVESAPLPKYLSPTAQQVLEESHGADQSTILVQSDIFDERLLHVLKGHVVNGAALCPSSMYADTAWTLANYLISNNTSSPAVDAVGLDVANLMAHNPLIAKPNETSHLFRVLAKANWAAATISMQVFSVDSNGKRTTSHAAWEVLLTPNQRWAAEWQRNAHFITARVDALTDGVHSGDSHLIKRGMAYKLFAALVDYSPEYQGMSQVVLDSQRLEAFSTVKFQVDSQGFTVSPKWIDSLGHIAGFIMNANDAVDSQKQVFINHGWERMRISEPLKGDKTYRAYNRMQLIEKTSYSGDTYILDGDRIIAIFEGVTFQGVPRSVLGNLLPGKKPASGNAKSVTIAPTAKPAVESSPRTIDRSPAPKSTTKQAPARTSVSTLSRILTVVAQEVGLEPSVFKPDSEFAELGIDSLLSLTITSKIREEIGLDFSSSVFMEYPTVGDLQVLIGENDIKSGPGSDSPQNSSSDEDSQDTQPTSDATSVTDEETDVSPSSARTIAALVLRQVIAEETQVALEELTASTALADVGVDSLLSLTISSTLQEALGVELASSVFMECETLQEIEDTLCKALGLEKKPVEKPVPPPQLSHKPVTQEPARQPYSVPESLPKATSILLAGSLKTANVLFFLFPDGSGSASSYAALAPALKSSEVAVYGLNCPWRKNGSDMTRLGINMSTMTKQYVAEVRRLLEVAQQGRNSLEIALGGWSAGGIVALEAARQLQQGPSPIQVSRLVLLDSPNPIGLQNPPQRMYDFFDSLGIFGGGTGGKTPDWLRAHFDAFLRILDDYEPSPLAGAPASMILYARDGVCKDPNGPKMETFPDDPREMLWLLNNRTDFSAEGWTGIIGQGNLSVEVLDEVNHFSLMDAGSTMNTLGGKVSQFLSKA